ncbi:MAG: NAD(P)-dependent oxidoreductase [Patescibacteria group bacterium]
MIDTSRILITGASGQLGRAFSVLLGDAMFTSRLELDCSWDTCKIISALEVLQPAAILHTAAYTNVDGAESDPAMALRVNGYATGALVEYCRSTGIPIVYFSTDYVLNSKSIEGHTESEVPNPQSVYGVSKYVGELYVGTYSRGTTIRLSGVFGEGANFVNTLLRLSESLNIIPVVCDQVMRPTYAPDAVQATLQLLEQHWSNGEWRLPPIIHMQNSGPAESWAQYAQQIFFLAGKKTRVQEIMFEHYAKNRLPKKTAPRPSDSILDCTLLESLGVDMSNWTESLKSFVENRPRT